MDRKEEELEELKESKAKPKKTSTRRRNEKSTFEKVINHSVTKTLLRELGRGLLGVMGLKGRR